MEKLPVSAQYALLEAMEQQSVTCTKAGMNVTLRSRCALLGAANPKYGRFDAETPLAEQFNLPAPLLSRFDLIFLSTDVPEKGFDAKLAAHICDSHEYGEAVAQKKIGKPGKTPEAKHIAPPILPKDLRLYIAYSRRTCFPKLTRKAKDAMISFYVKIRGQSGESQNKPVGITARQMEGLIRLAEASARERFSDEITEWDAERAVKIADKCLKQVAYDAASGTYDIDNVVSGMSKAKRDITRDILAVLDEMVKTGPVDEGDLVRNVVSRGYEPHDVDKVLTALKGSGGCLTNPRNNEIRRV
jgi:replicative DNA helicase Mcm